jgi:uncharacterized repeat protein (TIGR01451 family)
MKFYRLFLFFSVLVLGARLPGHAQYATWSRPLAPAAGLSRSVTDQAGNTYVAGSFQGALTLGATTFSAPTGTGNTNDSYLVKLNPQGLVQWAVGGVSAKTDAVEALALDPAGNVYVVFKAGLDTARSSTALIPFTFGSQTLPMGGTMLAKVTPAGAVTSLIHLRPGRTYAEVTGIAADAAGNCFLSVFANTGQTFASYTFPAAGTGITYCSAIFKVDATGNATMLKALVPTTGIQGSYYLRAQDLQLGAGGTLVCVGGLQGAAVLGTSPAVTLTAPGQAQGAFAVSLSAAGVPQWGVVNTVGSTGAASASGLSVAVGATGEVYMAGHASGIISFGSIATSTNGGYVLKLSAAGVPQWVRAALASDYAMDDNESAVRVAVDATGNVYKTGIFNRASATFGSITLNNTLPIPPIGANPLTAFYLVSYDAAGTARWAQAIDGRVQPIVGAGASNHQLTGLGCDASGNVYILNYLYPNAGGNAQLLLNAQVLSAGNTVLRLSPAGRLTGTLYIDQNNNGTRDAGEVPFPYTQVIADATQGVAYSSTPVTGTYSLFGLPGTAYNITIPNPHPYYSLPASATRTGVFPAVGQTTTGLDFGLVPQANMADVRVTLTPYSAPRPGFVTRYRLTVQNVGTTTVTSGTATLTLDNQASYISSTPSGSLSGQTVTWTYPTLTPFSQLDFEVLFSLPVNAVLGTQLTSTATTPLTGDAAPADNTTSLVQTVVGSYDPNAIEVNYQRLSPTQVAARQPLDYTIHFQNLGTAEALGVAVSDTLDYQKLNLASLMLVAQSHNCLWSLTNIGPNTGLLTVRFPGINLPARNVDVIGSQGFVRFRVQPRPTLAVGEIIPNRAGIVFDYNAPIMTNTATTIVFLATAALNRHDAPAWDAYPNPATDAVTVSADLNAAGPVRVELLDVLGRPVRQQSFTAPAGPLRQTVNLQGLAAGVYVLRLTPPTGPATSRQVVRE